MYCQCYRRNPDLDGRQIERQLQQNFNDPELRLKLLNAKYRSGKLAVDNVLFRLAGLLGDPAVRQFAAEIGLRDTWGELARPDKFPRLLFKRLIDLHPQALTPLNLVSTADHTSQVRERLRLIAGLTALLLPVIESETTGEDFGWSGAVLQLKEFVRSLKLPTARAAYDDSWSPSFIFWALDSVNRNAQHQRNLWLGCLEPSGDILANYDKKFLYENYRDRFDRYLYSWDVDLPAGIPLLTYLRD